MLGDRAHERGSQASEELKRVGSERHEDKHKSLIQRALRELALQKTSCSNGWCKPNPKQEVMDDPHYRRRRSRAQVERL